MRRSPIFEFLNKQPVLTGRQVRLRPRKLEDGADEYRWRTDEELCRLDAAIPLDFSFADFLDRYSIELEFPGLTYTLAIDTLDGMHIGQCSLFNLDFLNGSIEIGIMIGEKALWGRGYGTDSVETFKSHIFETSDVDIIVLRTLDWNQRARRCFQKCGFTPCGNLTKGEHNFVLMDIRRSSTPGNLQ